MELHSVLLLTDSCAGDKVSSGEFSRAVDARIDETENKKSRGCQRGLALSVYARTPRRVKSD